MSVTRRVRDEAFAAKLKQYGTTGRAPLLNADIAAEEPCVTPITQFKVLDQFVPFSMELANEYLGLPIFPGERQVEDAHAQKILTDMTRGMFNWDLVVLARCSLNGIIYKNNGQHTCWARFACRMTIPDPLVREIHYAVSTAAELRSVYSTYDRAKPKTDAHLLEVTLLGQDLDPRIRKSWAVLAGTGLKFWQFPGAAYGKVRDSDLVTALADPVIRDAFTRVCLFGQGVHREESLIKRQPVVAAMLATFAKDPAAALTFWTDVTFGTNLTRGEPRWLLHGYLARSVLQFSSKNGRDRQVVGTEDMYRVCLHLWNKWRAGAKSEVIRVLATRPKVL